MAEEFGKCDRCGARMIQIFTSVKCEAACEKQVHVNAPLTDISVAKIGEFARKMDEAITGRAAHAIEPMAGASGVGAVYHGMRPIKSRIHEGDVSAILAEGEKSGHVGWTHLHLPMVDDPHQAEADDSEEARARTAEWFTEMMPKRSGIAEPSYSITPGQRRGEWVLNAPPAVPGTVRVITVRQQDQRGFNHAVFVAVGLRWDHVGMLPDSLAYSYGNDKLARYLERALNGGSLCHDVINRADCPGVAGKAALNLVSNAVATQHRLQTGPKTIKVTGTVAWSSADGPAEPFRPIAAGPNDHCRFYWDKHTQQWRAETHNSGPVAPFTAGADIKAGQQCTIDASGKLMPISDSPRTLDPFSRRVFPEPVGGHLGIVSLHKDDRRVFLAAGSEVVDSVKIFVLRRGSLTLVEEMPIGRLIVAGEPDCRFYSYDVGVQLEGCQQMVIQFLGLRGQFMGSVTVRPAERQTESLV